MDFLLDQRVSFIEHILGPPTESKTNLLKSFKKAQEQLETLTLQNPQLLDKIKQSRQKSTWPVHPAIQAELVFASEQQLIQLADQLSKLKAYDLETLQPDLENLQNVEIPPQSDLPLLMNRFYKLNANYEAQANAMNRLLKMIEKSFSQKKKTV